MEKDTHKEINMPLSNNNSVFISPSFTSIKNKLSNYSLASFHNSNKVNEYVEEFGLRKLCSKLDVDRISSNNNDLERSVVPFDEKPYEPVYSDLCRLHYLALSRKFINVLEFGSGFSTVVIADALRLLSTHFGEWVDKSIRCERPFHIYAVEEEQRFLEITMHRLSDGLEKFATILRSSVELITHDNRIATLYSKLPNISPDFIYLDGPCQFGSTAELNGFSLNSIVRMPMSADILRFEFFLEPGTLILVDGRTQNARFLKSYLKRDWNYQHDPIGDIHYFELQESALGPYNQRKMDFCLDGKWLLDKRS
jgi:hypothetical protein